MRTFKIVLVLALGIMTGSCQTGLAYIAPLTSLEQFSIDDARHAKELAISKNRLTDAACLEKFINTIEFVLNAHMGAQGFFVESQIVKTVREEFSPSCVALLTGFR